MAAGTETLTAEQASHLLDGLQRRSAPPEQTDRDGVTSWVAPCPSHGDDGQPLVLTRIDASDRWLLTCHGPCDAHDVRITLEGGISSPNWQPTWSRLDLSTHLDGTHRPQVPELLARTDGVCLLYAGRVHSFHGESESGKSWASLVAAAAELIDGGQVLMLDYESDAATVVGRLLALGVDPGSIRDGFDYRRPDTAPDANPAESAAFDGLLAQRYDLVILDGVTEALATVGVSSIDNDEVTTWVRQIPRAVAVRTGAAVVLVDHVTKSSDDRGRFAMGAQAKMAALDGAAYVVEVVEPIGAGMRGRLALRVGKDRPGGVRPHAGPWRKGDRTQEAAVITLDSTVPGRTVATVDPPRTPSAPPGQHDGQHGGSPWRPTFLMEKVSQLLEDGGPTSGRGVLDGVRGRDDNVRAAIAALIDGKYVSADGPKKGGHPMLVSLRPFRQSVRPDEPDALPSPLPLDRVVRPASPIEGGRTDALNDTESTAARTHPDAPGRTPQDGSTPRALLAPPTTATTAATNTQEYLS